MFTLKTGHDRDARFVPAIVIRRAGGMLKSYERQGARGARIILRYVIAGRTSITRRVHRVKWRLCRRIGPPQHDLGKGRMSRAQESFRENVGLPFRDFSPTPPWSCYSDHEMKDQSYITCPSHYMCPTIEPSNVYAALAPLVIYLPVKPCVPVLATSALP